MSEGVIHSTCDVVEDGLRARLATAEARATVAEATLASVRAVLACGPTDDVVASARLAKGALGEDAKAMGTLAILDALGWSDDCGVGPVEWARALHEQAVRDEKIKTLRCQAAEIDALKAGLRALTNIRDEGAAETHRWRERALAAEASFQRTADAYEAADEDARTLRGRLNALQQCTGPEPCMACLKCHGALIAERDAEITSLQIDISDLRQCPDGEACGECVACMASAKRELGVARGRVRELENCGARCGECVTCLTDYVCTANGLIADLRRRLEQQEAETVAARHTADDLVSKEASDLAALTKRAEDAETDFDRLDAAMDELIALAGKLEPLVVNREEIGDRTPDEILEAAIAEIERQSRVIDELCDGRAVQRLHAARARAKRAEDRCVAYAEELLKTRALGRHNGQRRVNGSLLGASMVLRDVCADCERATEETKALRERLKSMSERWERTAADLDLAVSFARRGWEGARAWRENAISEEKSRVQHLKSICRAARDHLPFHAGPDAVESLPDVAMETTRRLTLAEGEAKALRGQRDDLVVELRKRTEDLVEATRALEYLRERYAPDAEEEGWDAFLAFVRDPTVDTLFLCVSEGGRVFEIDVSRFQYLLQTGGRIEKLDAEVAHLKANRAQDEAQIQRVMASLDERRERLCDLMEQIDRVTALCRADLDRPASIESRASRSLAWSVLRELGVTVPGREPEKPAPEAQPSDLSGLAARETQAPSKRSAFDLAKEMAEERMAPHHVALAAVQERKAAAAPNLALGMARHARLRAERTGSHVATTYADAMDQIHGFDSRLTAKPEPEPTAMSQAATIGPGEGWRLLRDGEAVEDGDEYRRLDGTWWPTSDAGHTHCTTGVPRRRRIASTKNPPRAWEKFEGCGWRYLAKNETYEEGDELFIGDAWRPTTCIGEKHNFDDAPFQCRARRLLSRPTAEAKPEPSEEADPPAIVDDLAHEAHTIMLRMGREGAAYAVEARIKTFGRDVSADPEAMIAEAKRYFTESWNGTSGEIERLVMCLRAYVEAKRSEQGTAVPEPTAYPPSGAAEPIAALEPEPTRPRCSECGGAMPDDVLPSCNGCVVRAAHEDPAAEVLVRLEPEPRPALPAPMDPAERMQLIRAQMAGGKS